MRGAAFIYPGRPVLPPEHGRPTTLPSPGPNQNGRLYRRLLGLSLQDLPLRPSKAAEWLDNTGFVHRYTLVEVCEAGKHAEGVEKGIAEVVAQVEQIMDQDQVAVACQPTSAQAVPCTPVSTARATARQACQRRCASHKTLFPFYFSYLLLSSLLVVSFLLDFMSSSVFFSFFPYVLKVTCLQA